MQCFIYVDAEKENETTPRKVYGVSDICRLCGCAGKRYVKLYGRVAKEKSLIEKIKLVTGLSLIQTDELTDNLCLKCERSVENMFKFRLSCHQVQREIHRKCSVKRVISPPKSNPEKRQSTGT